MGARISQEVIEPLGIGTPNARISQEVIEPLGVAPRNCRVTQQVLESLAILPRKARVTQQFVEFLYVPLTIGPGNPGVIGIGSESDSVDMVYPITPQVSTR
jgi:hypothetical protein